MTREEPFQILDAKYNYDKGGNPLIQLFGVTLDGKPVQRTIEGFKPYFYVGFSDGDPSSNYDKLVRSGLRHVEHCLRYRPVGYQESKSDFYKIVLKDPKMVGVAREAVKEIEGLSDVYEADILFKTRYLVDHDLGGMSWTADGKSPIECSENAPLKYMALDLEVLPPKTGGMPVSYRDPIIMCSMVFSTEFYGETELLLYSDNEKDLLWQIINVINNYDPDILLGYNSDNFDFPYLIKRCQVHDLKLKVGRDGSYMYSSGTGEFNETICSGRVCVDVLKLIRRGYSLKQYNLKTAASLVSMEKGDVSVRDMRRLWESKDPTFLEYAIQDARITMRLALDLKLLDKYIALSRLTGTLLFEVINGGQTKMIENLLLREFKRADRLMPMRPQGVDPDSEGYEGAVVLDPPHGLQDNLVILDYKSLYPTIIMAHNICYSTLITGDDTHGLDHLTSPVGAKFVSEVHYRGIMPAILSTLLDERLAVKAAMKAETDNAKRSVLNAKQEAVKILLNSFYGYAGFQRSRLYTVEVAASVTAYGRENITRTKELIENAGYRVVYGDTDSVFVAAGTGDLEQLKEIGQRLAALATSQLPPPMELVFEAVARRCFFSAKKRYAMWRFEEYGGSWHDKIKIKGMETVRRDWTELTSDVLNGIIVELLQNGDPNAAVKVCQEAISRVRSLDYTDTETLGKLLLTRRYRGDHKFATEQPHDAVAQKCLARGTKAYMEGDRVPYVIITGGDSTFMGDSRIRSTKLVDRAEDLDWAIEHHLQIDTDYYIRRQIISPALRLLGTFGVTEDILLNGHALQPKTITTQSTLW